MSDPPTAPEGAREAGNGAFRAGRLEEALEHYTRAMEEDATDTKSRTNAALVCLRLGDFEAAEGHAAAALALDGTLDKAHYRRGDALLRLERYEEAQDALAAGCEASPGNKTLEKSLAVASLMVDYPLPDLLPLLTEGDPPPTTPFLLRDALATNLRVLGSPEFAANVSRMRMSNSKGWRGLTPMVVSKYGKLEDATDAMSPDLQAAARGESSTPVGLCIVYCAVICYKDGRQAWSVQPWTNTSTMADAIKSVEATAIQEAVLDATMKLANDGLVSEPVAAVAD